MDWLLRWSSNNFPGEFTMSKEAERLMALILSAAYDACKTILLSTEFFFGGMLVLAKEQDYWLKGATHDDRRTSAIVPGGVRWDA